MKILLLFFTLALASCAGCFPDPEPECPQDCEEVRGLEGYLEGCFCPPHIFDDYCEDEREEHAEESCKEGEGQ